MTYIVFYTKNATPMIKQFKTKDAAIRFANKHEKLNTIRNSDDWVDCIVEGKVVKTYPFWYDKQIKE